MLVFSSLHVHERLAFWGEDCVDCVNHLPHAGHLSLNTNTSHDCVLCQFTMLPFVQAVAVAVGLVSIQSTIVVLPRPSVVLDRCGRLQIPRAPPAV